MDKHATKTSTVHPGQWPSPCMAEPWRMKLVLNDSNQLVSLKVTSGFHCWYFSVQCSCGLQFVAMSVYHSKEIGEYRNMCRVLSGLPAEDSSASYWDHIDN